MTEQAPVSQTQTTGSLLKKAVGARLFFPVVCLVLVLVLNVIVKTAQMGSPWLFFKISIVNGALNGPLITLFDLASELVIVSVAMTVVVSCSAGVDISVGSVMAFSSSVMIWLLGYGTLAQNHYHVVSYVVPLVVGLLVAVVVGAICGAWNGFLVSRLRIQPMVATLILYTGARGAAKVVSKGQINQVDPPSFKWFGTASVLPLPTSILIAAVVVLATVLVLRFTALGMNIQSVGINAKASRIVGLSARRIVLGAFIFAGVCAAIAGIIYSSRQGQNDFQNNGKMIELDAILAVALGGNSLAGGRLSLPGTVIGAITIQTLSSVMYSISVSPDQLPLFKALVVVIIVVLQSTELRPMLQRTLARIRRHLADVDVFDTAAVAVKAGE